MHFCGRRKRIYPGSGSVYDGGKQAKLPQYKPRDLADQKLVLCSVSLTCCLRPLVLYLTCRHGGTRAKPDDGQRIPHVQLDFPELERGGIHSRSSDICPTTEPYCRVCSHPCQPLAGICPYPAAVDAHVTLVHTYHSRPSWPRYGGKPDLWPDRSLLASHR